jgi:hypothetical protein
MLCHFLKRKTAGVSGPAVDHFICWRFSAQIHTSDLVPVFVQTTTGEATQFSQQSSFVKDARVPHVSGFIPSCRHRSSYGARDSTKVIGKQKARHSVLRRRAL